jgi:hypothetical protein
LQRQANCEDVKSFWRTTESEQIDADIHLMGKKMERTIVRKYQFMGAIAIQAVPNFADCDLQIKFGLDQSTTGNKAQKVLNASKIKFLKRKADVSTLPSILVIKL